MIRTDLKVMRRELGYMWRDRGLRNILLFGPLLGLLLFAGIYAAQTITNIPTAIVDLDRSASSREIADKMDNAPNLKVAGYPQTYEELEDLIGRGKVVVGVVIPENFGRDVSLHRHTRVLLIIDASNTIFATNASTAVLGVTRTLSAEIGVKTLLAQGMDPIKARDMYLSVDLKEEGWFNPTLNYAYFLVLAMALNIWQQCCSIAASINIIGETGVKSWLQIKAAGFSKLRLFISKSAVHITIFMVMAVLIYIIAFGIFKIPLACKLSTLLLFTLVFAFALHSIGTLMSSIANNAVDSTRFSMMVALPSFALCGYTWPIEAMPRFLQPVVWVFPQTWFFQGFNYLSFKNPGWQFMASYFYALIAIAFICYGLTTVITAWRER